MMMEDGGVRGMWRGNFINVLKITPETAIKFATYDYFKRLIKRNKETELHAYERFLSGSFAGIISQSVIYPLEVLKTRLVLRKTGQYTGIVNAAFAIYRNEGPRTFYKGFTANIIGITLFAGIDFTLYEALKKFLLPPKLDNWSISMLLICGGLSSTCGELIAYPFALCRTKLQADSKFNFIFLYRIDHLNSISILFLSTFFITHMRIRNDIMFHMLFISNKA